MLSVFWHFLVLGLYSFGGPAAHIGYFQRAFVEDKKWLTSSEFNQAVALCQFLPGPASSQLGMFIGYKKGHYLGALAAFVGFTLPSFVLLTILAVMSSSLSDSGWLDAVIQAAKLLAVIVVADALWGMGKKNITSKTTFFVCLLTAIWVYFSVGLLGQILPILAAAAIGYALSFVKKGQNEATQLLTQLPKVKPNLVILSCFCILLVGMPFIANILPIANIFNIFYQAGSFVFGGGHVVLPLLQPMMDGLVEPDKFLTAYASAQLVPGPMFTMASYLGAAAYTASPIIGSLVATIAVFLPGALLLFAFLPAWEALFSHPRLQIAISLVNASVVGLLASAFISPVITSSIHSIFDLIVVITGGILLKRYNLPIWGLASLLVLYTLI